MNKRSKWGGRQVALSDRYWVDELTIAPLQQSSALMRDDAG
ncbi:hypothetical protein [Sphingomonas folli]|nr:hypothetical protein [Sphingomonas folli]